MANSILTIDMITREAVRLWKNTNAFMQHVDMQFDDSYAKTGAKIGDTLRIRLPNDYIVRTGPAVNVQGTAEQNTTLVLATMKGVDVSFTTQERTMKLDDYSRRVLAPMVNNLAGAVAADIMGGIDSQGGACNFVANYDVSNNILPPVAETYLTAGAYLDLNSAPTEDRRAITDPVTMARSVASFSGLLNPQAEISEQYRSGMLRTAWGLDYYKDQTVLKHTCGTLSSGGTVNGATQTGSTITVNATTGTINIGDIITIDGVNAVNRITKQSTGQLRQFVATAAAISGATSIAIYPALIPVDLLGNPVQYQTVDVSPANGAQVRMANAAGQPNAPSGIAAVTATYRKNFLFSPDGVSMAMADLELPKGVHEAARESFDGVSMRMITDYVVATDQMITRLDVLYGYKYLRPEWLCVCADAI